MEQHNFWDTKKTQSLSRWTHHQDMKDNHDRWDQLRQMISGFKSFILHLALLSSCLPKPQASPTQLPPFSPLLPHLLLIPPLLFTPHPRGSAESNRQSKVLNTAKILKDLYPWRQETLQDTGWSFTSSFYPVWPCSCWWGVWWNNPNK